MSFLPKKAIWSALSIKALSLMLYMPSDHVVIVTLAEKHFSAWLFKAHSFAGSKGITEYSRAVPWLFLPWPCFAPFGQGGRWRTGCGYWLRAFAETTDSCSSPPRGMGLQLLLGSGAAADTKNCARTNEPSKNRAFQKFWDTLLVCMKVLTFFPKGDGRIIFFQV